MHSCETMHTRWSSSNGKVKLSIMFPQSMESDHPTVSAAPPSISFLSYCPRSSFMCFYKDVSNAPRGLRQ